MTGKTQGQNHWSLLSAFELESAFDLRVHLTCDCGTQARDLKGNLPQNKQSFVKKKSDLSFRHYIVLTILRKKKFKKPDLLGLWKNPLTIPCLIIMNKLHLREMRSCGDVL